MQLNSTQTHLSHQLAAFKDTTSMKLRSSDFVMFSISATVEQRDLHLRPENQLIKPIAGKLINKIT
jgi:hypothetical protein